MREKAGMKEEVEKKREEHEQEREGTGELQDER